jgi:hypothetical protein
MQKNSDTKECIHFNLKGLKLDFHLRDKLLQERIKFVKFNKLK